MSLVQHVTAFEGEDWEPEAAEDDDTSFLLPLSRQISHESLRGNIRHRRTSISYDPVIAPEHEIKKKAPKPAYEVPAGKRLGMLLSITTRNSFNNVKPRSSLVSFPAHLALELFLGLLP
jgi:hypothetical protein